KHNLPCHIEVDTGMSRMGFSLENFAEILSEFKKMNLKISGLFSHFADADNANNEFTKQQEENFKLAISETHKAGFKPKWIHLANSAGALKTNIEEVNMIRLGFSLYGYSPYSREDKFFEPLKELKPAMKLYSHIIACREIKPGDKVSYNCTFEAKEKMLIGTIPLGYYEAIPRSLSNKGPFLGRICMNHSIIKVDAKNKIGDEVEIFGNLNELAKLAGTIPYELMTRISETLKREIVD
ncbi:alanine racemase, partial [Candidatus Peregrinibacteria bacterium]|nr:alanine racemase [Candidatus Peregrinibacteria bacterium]